MHDPSVGSGEAESAEELLRRLEVYRAFRTLAAELGRAGGGGTLYILDEPTTGLHFADVDRLLGVLHRLAGLGNTLIVIEHNLDVIKSADWVVDLGPEAGDAGGRVVAMGTPRQVAETAESHTGHYLRSLHGI